MKTGGQVGNGIIWGAGCLLITFGAFFLLRAQRDSGLGEESLAVLETFVGAVLVLFGGISFYLAHK